MANFEDHDFWVGEHVEDSVGSNRKKLSPPSASGPAPVGLAMQAFTGGLESADESLRCVWIIDRNVRLNRL
jgi:hypothetical protein